MPLQAAHQNFEATNRWTAGQLDFAKYLVTLR
jgi:hypothetical protein